MKIAQVWVQYSAQTTWNSIVFHWLQYPSHCQSLVQNLFWLYFCLLSNSILPCFGVWRRMYENDFETIENGI